MIVVSGDLQAGDLAESNPCLGVRFRESHHVTELGDVAGELGAEIAGAKYGKSQSSVAHGSFHLTTSVTVF